MPKIKTAIIKWATFCLLLILAGIQFSYVWQDYAKEMWPNVPSYVPTLERSEIMVVGANDARYLRFLDLYLPEDAFIVGAPVRQFGSQNRMQWFLLPRNTAPSCNEGFTAACLALINAPNTVVLAIKDFPPMQEIPGKIFIPYPFASKDIHGVYVPKTIASQLKVPVAEQFASAPVRSPRYFLQDLFIIGLLFVLGALFLSLILALPSWLDYLSLSLPLAFAVLTWIIFFTSWLGIPITRLNIGLYLALLSVFALLANRRWNRSWISFPSVRLKLSQSALPRSLPNILLSVLLIALFCLAAGIAIGRSYSAFDEIANWGLKGYAMAQFGTIRAGAYFGGHVLSYPLNIPLSIALFRIGDGDLIPGSKLIFPILAAGLFIQIYTFLRRHGVSAALILAAGIFLFTVPDLFKHSTLAFANLPLTAYLIPAALWTMDGILENRIRWVLLGGVLFACAAWTRPEGIGIALLLLVGTCAFLYIRRREFPQLTFLACSLAPMILPLLWMVLIGSHFISGDQIGNALSVYFGQVAKGNFELWAIPKILLMARRVFFAPREGVGFILPLSSLLIILGWSLSYQRRNLPAQVTLLLTILAALFPVGMFYIAAGREPNYAAFLEQSFNRAFFPALVLLLVTALLLFARTEKDKEIA